MMSFLIFALLYGNILGHGMKHLTVETSRGKIQVLNFSRLRKHRLNMAPMASFEVTQDMKCTSSCLKSQGCVSFNVKKLSTTAFLCELLNTSKYGEEEHLTQDDSFYYYYLQDPCFGRPCVGGTCAPNSMDELICHCSSFTAGKKCDECKDSNHNFALGKPTEQSSTHKGAGPSLAVDGDMTTRHFYAGDNTLYCVHTSEGSQNWWRVDFLERVLVARVAILNRGDCCWDRMRDLEIRVGDSLIDNGLRNPKCGDRHNAGPGMTNIMCTPSMGGRHLLIQSMITEAMNFCEVQVYCA